MMVAGLQRARGFFGQKGLLVGFVMIVNTYSWNFPLYILFESEVLKFVNGDGFVFAYVIATYYLASVLSAFAGVFLVSRYQIRDKILVSWMFSGVLSSVLLVFLPNASLAGNYPYLYFILLLLGFSLGFGFPSSLSYFSDYNVENKGTRAGTAFLATGFGILIMGFLSTTLLPFEISVLIFALWRGIGCILFLLLRPKQEEANSPYLNVTYRYILGERRFVLYFLPWIVYATINYFAVVVLQGFFLNEPRLGQPFIESMLIAEFAIGGIVALVAGIMSDRIGRKPVIASGFVALGIGYALLALFMGSTEVAYVYVLVDGVSFGIFAMAFFLLLWGELAIDKSKEKYYVLGELPFLVFSYLGILIRPHASLEQTPPTAFSLAAFFLFLAILPLMYAPETLPQTKIRERELKSYIEKAKKTKEKRT